MNTAQERNIYENEKRKPGVVAHACNPCTLGGGDRRIRVRDQPQRALSLSLLSLSLSLSLCLSLLSEALRNFVRPGFKIKYKNKGGRAWWRTLVIPVLWEAETGGSRFAASLSSSTLSLSLSLWLSLST